jgi:hypothetical protein
MVKEEKEEKELHMGWLGDLFFKTTTNLRIFIFHIINTVRRRELAPASLLHGGFLLLTPPPHEIDPLCNRAPPRFGKCVRRRKMKIHLLFGFADVYMYIVPRGFYFRTYAIINVILCALLRDVPYTERSILSIYNL